MMDLDAFDIIEMGNKISIGVCVLIIFQNAALYSPKFFNFFLNLQIKTISSFMAAGGILLYMQKLVEAPVLGASEHVPYLNVFDSICGDVFDTMCIKYSSNSSLPKAWFEDVKQHFHTNNTRCVAYFLCVLMFANCDLFAKGLLSGISCSFLKRRGIAHLLPLATSIMLPDDNEKERRHAVVQLMIRRLQHLQINIVYFMIVEISYLSVALFGLIVNPVRVMMSDSLPIRLNGAEWKMICGREITFQDDYAMVRCRSICNGGKIDSYCIVPNNSSLFHLESATYFFFLLLALSCAVSLLHKIYGICKFGIRRTTDMNLIKFLKHNVDYRRHKAIIDLFEIKLEERTRKMIEEDNGKSSKTGEKEIALPLAKDLEQGVVANNEDALVVRMDEGISNPD